VSPVFVVGRTEKQPVNYKQLLAENVSGRFGLSGLIRDNAHPFRHSIVAGVGLK